METDGYSAFGQANPYATFPSAGLGWRISDEAFFKAKWIDNLKLRASWGANGNRDIGIYDALAKLSSTHYLYGNSTATGVYSSNMANSELKWEKTTALNFGLDFDIFNKHISGTFDTYFMNTNGLITYTGAYQIL